MFRTLRTPLISALICSVQILSVPAAALADDSSALRTWSDLSGTFTVSASLSRIDSDKVTLLREDGKAITIPSAQLSEADRQYIAEVRDGKSEVLELDATTGDVKLRKTTADPVVAGGPSAGYIESEVDVSVAPQLELSAADEAWSYQADGVAAVKSLASKQVRLPVALKAMPSNLSISVLPGSRKALVSFRTREGTKSEDCTIVVCDVNRGLVETLATVAGEMPLAISPDGKLIANATVESPISSGAELRLYRRDGTRVKRLIIWRPYGDGKDISVGSRVQWAWFIDEQRLLTRSDGGLLALWEVPDVAPLWCAKLEGDSTPAISPGGKYLATIADQKLVLVDLASTSAVGSIPSALSSARLAFRADGRRVAGISGDRICVWDLESKEVYRDFNLLSSASSSDSFAWIDDNHLLVDDLVVDLDRRIPIWRHMHTLGCTVQDGRLWFVRQPSGTKELVLASTRAVPQRALDTLAKLKPEELLVLGPGMEVSVEISASGDVQSARDVLERKLKDNGMKVVSRGMVRLIGTVTPGESREIRMLNFGQSRLDPNAGTTHTITEHSVNLCFKVGEQTVWRRDYPANLPHFINMKEGETVDQALQRLTYRDASFLTGYELPKYLARLPESITK
jgi:hypothetical protein